MVMAGEVRTTLHKTHVEAPNGQNLVNTPNNVMGIVRRHNIKSATAKVAMKIFLAVLIPNKKRRMSFTTNFYIFSLTQLHCKCLQSIYSQSKSLFFVDSTQYFCNSDFLELCHNCRQKSVKVVIKYVIY